MKNLQPSFFENNQNEESLKENVRKFTSLHSSIIFFNGLSHTRKKKPTASCGFLFLAKD